MESSAEYIPAGKSKSMLDPFKKEKTEDVKRLKDILSQLHEVFISHVKGALSLIHISEPTRHA